jgi:hypothetical protein
MENKIEFEKYLYPAILIEKATGREKNPCLFCKSRFKEGDSIVELYSSAYKGNISYTNRFCSRCFLKVLMLNFPELISENNSLSKEINKDLILRKLEESN